MIELRTDLKSMPPLAVVKDALRDVVTDALAAHAYDLALKDAKAESSQHTSPGDPDNVRGPWWIEQRAASYHARLMKGGEI